MTDGSVFDLPVLAASRWMFTCYAILGDDGSVVMVDAGLPSSAQGALNSLRGAGRQPEDVTAVLATHGHSDHVGGMSTVLDQTAARALLPERCRHYLEGETPRNFGVDANVRFLPMMGQHPFKPGALRELAQVGRTDGYGRRPTFALPFIPSGYLADGDPVPGARLDRDRHPGAHRRLDLSVPRRFGHADVRGRGVDTRWSRLVQPRVGGSTGALRHRGATAGVGCSLPAARSWASRRGRCVGPCPVGGGVPAGSGHPHPVCASLRSLGLTPVRLAVRSPAIQVDSTAQSEVQRTRSAHLPTSRVPS